MIARIWHGNTAAADAGAYADHMKETGVKTCLSTPGNAGVLLLQHPQGDEVRFTFLSLWESMDSIRGFAGENPAIPRYFPEDERYLTSADSEIVHKKAEFWSPNGESGQKTRAYFSSGG